MQMIKRMLIVVGIISLLLGCATVSEKKLEQAQQSLQQGDYTQAFDQAAHSLQAEIGNHKAIAMFVSLVEGAYAQKFSEIAQYKADGNRDQVAYSYDRIISMNQTVQKIQNALAVYAPKVQVTKAKRAAMNQLLAMRPHNVDSLHDEAYELAAASHYDNGKRYADSQTYRQASQEYNKALSFISDYRDAVALAAKTKHLADLADAKRYYAEGQLAVQNQLHRAAAIAFTRADRFIPGFRDAYNLASRYKGIADLEDAHANYIEGERLATEQRYRAAVTAFEVALSFVPNYRDAYELAAHYTDLANRQDARKFYRKGKSLMDRHDFEQAAHAFDRADQFVPGFRDAREMASRARSYIPPERYQLKHLVQLSVLKGIPLSWLHDVHRGYTEDVKITTVRVIRRGRFNDRHEFWPYRLRVTGTCELEMSRDNEQVVSFDTAVDYRLFRDDFGGWKASFRQNRGSRHH